MAQIENRLTWSKSRAEVFHHCKRKYWWTYYGSWGGWASDGPERAREAYLLKNLHSRWTWAGHVVHRAIESVLRRLQRDGAGGELALDGPGPLDPAREVDALTRGMRAQFRDSRDGRYRRDPKRVVGLVEHEYGEPITDDEWREVNRRAVEGLSTFLASPVFERLRASDPSTWLPFEQLDSFEVDGVPVWVALDFARRTPDGAEVYDWKTGAERPDENRLQLLCYSLYLQARFGIPADRVTCHLVYVNAGTVHEWRAQPADLDGALDTIRASIVEMRRALDAGVAAPDAFPMTDDLGRCATCAFRRLCGR